MNEGIEGRKEWWERMSDDEKRAFIKDRAEEIAKYRHGIDTSIGNQMLLSYAKCVKMQQ
jgi:hypothetical protein